MNPREAGFLLLTGSLGDPERKPLTIPQLRNLANRARQEMPYSPDKEVEPEDIMALGYSQQEAQRIVALLSGKAQLMQYLHRGQKQDCYPVTRVSSGYPEPLRARLGLNAPGCLWGKGDWELLDYPAVALVGSRDLKQENEQFAREVGRQAALQNYTLISGNARGADRTAQDSCLENGGRVISIVADELGKYPYRKNVLYLSEEGFDLPFSTPRALSRNRIIHTMPTHGVFVAQCRVGAGGTWNGTLWNLQKGHTPVFCLEDGSPAVRELCNRGAVAIGEKDLKNIAGLQAGRQRLF